MSIHFTAMRLHTWRQFEDVDINFHERLTILTGANGAGKTTILNLLARHFGWSIDLIGTLRITKKGARRYFSGVLNDESLEDTNSTRNIGHLRYSNQEEAQLSVPVQVKANYNLTIKNQQRVDGVYITSHRPVYAYQRVDSIPTEVSATEELFDQYLNNLRQYYTPRARVESPSYRLKSSLISLATFGYGNRAVESNLRAKETFESFQSVLRKVLPPDLEFENILIRLPDVILKCAGSEFSLDAASGGVAALIDLSWQIHMKSLTSNGFCVVLDEPENHLHPRLQRAVLPGLLDAFPTTQFIIATHNPFVVTSVSDSEVAVLDFERGRVKSRNINDFDRAASANKVLSDVLGVPFPMPLWVENEVERIIVALQRREINERTLIEVRRQLSELGLGSMFPTVVERLLGRGGESN